MAMVGATGIATPAASTKSATGITAIAAIFLKLATQARVLQLMIMPIIAATLVVSVRRAIGTAAIAAIVLTLVRRVLATVLRGATVIATLVVSTKSATGMAATAAIALTRVL
jgi:hypothetical protein